MQMSCAGTAVRNCVAISINEGLKRFTGEHTDIGIHRIALAIA
jgi:hypothetical protein